MGVFSDYGSVVVIGVHYFYNIEGIFQNEIQNSNSAQTGEENSTFNFPFVRIAHNEGTVRTYGINTDLEALKLTDFTSGEDLYELLKRTKVGNFGGTKGTNTSIGSLTQTD